MMSYQSTGFTVVRGLIGPELVEYMRIQIEMLQDVICLNKGTSKEYAANFADSLVAYSFPIYGTPTLDSMCLMLQPRVEEIVGIKLLPTYAYARLMKAGAEMAKHRDRDSCEHSITMCIEQHEPYPIWIEDYQGNAHKVTLNPGDGLIYHGTKLAHWREQYTGSGHIQMFVHYTLPDAGGNSRYKFDGRQMMGTSRMHWPS